MVEDLLVVDAVDVRFGGVRVLGGVTLGARAGQVTGLIGPNGAGKTTLFNVITGLVNPHAGSVVVCGVVVNSLAPHRRARLGMARTFQRLELFVGASVRDNLRTAADIANAARGWRRAGRIDPGRMADQVIERLGLGDVAATEVSELPTGTARRVELARALMVQPRVLLLDEPAAGLSDAETASFQLLLRELATQDQIAVVLVEHDVALVVQSCDVIHVLDMGVVISSGTPAQVCADPRVREAYLGAV